MHDYTICHDTMQVETMYDEIIRDDTMYDDAT